MQLSGRVFNGLTSGALPLPGYGVQLFTSSAAYSQVTDINGSYHFDVPLPAGQFINAQASTVSFGRFTLPVVGTFGVQPLTIFTNGVLFPVLATNVSGITRLANVDFFVKSPPPPAAILSAMPTNPMCGMAVRADGAGGLGEEVTIFGTNLHSEMEFYLAPISATFPSSPDVWTRLPVTVLSSDPGGHWVTVRAPFVPEFVREYTNGVFLPSFQSPWQWVAHDSWFRPGRIEYSYFGSFDVRPPPYPIVHGFNFKNQESPPYLEEFLGAYGYSAYICIGVAGHCVSHVPDPLYLSLWFPVHQQFIERSHGSCVGMAGASMLLFNHVLVAQDYDPMALTANGIIDQGPPGVWDTSNAGGAFTRPPIPVDIWARIRLHHGVQTSAEYLNHALSQLDGNPVGRLPELRAGTTAQTVCMVRIPEGGHCVTPYLVEDNFGGDTNLTRIWVYDNNAPCPTNSFADASCVTNHFIDIDHAANEYSFPDLGWTGDKLITVPSHLYTDDRTAPGLFDLSELLGNLIVIVAGDADAYLTTPGGNEWGWRADGSFVSNMPGVRSVPILGSPDNLTRSVPIFVPISNGIPDINIQMRGTNENIFHVAAGGTMLQLDMARSLSGMSNRIELGVISNQLSSFRFIPQVAITNFTPRIGFQLGSNACAAFQWIGLDGEGGHALEFRAVKNRHAVEYYNDTGKATQHYLRIDAVDGPSSNDTCAVFGPFDVPAGAVQGVVMNDWPRVGEVQSEMDLDADGIPETVTTVTGTSIDSDGDSMPDDWETLHQLNPMSSDGDDGADGDPDMDGISNFGEYLSGTDPHDPASVLRVSVMLLPNNGVRLSWTAIPGRRYEIEYADDLWQIFRPIPGAGFPRTATGTVEFFEDVRPADSGTRFYRLSLVP